MKASYSTRDIRLVVTYTTSSLDERIDFTFCWIDVCVTAILQRFRNILPLDKYYSNVFKFEYFGTVQSNFHTYFTGWFHFGFVRKFMWMLPKEVLRKSKLNISYLNDKKQVTDFHDCIHIESNILAWIAFVINTSDVYYCFSSVIADFNWWICWFWQCWIRTGNWTTQSSLTFVSKSIWFFCWLLNDSYSGLWHCWK